MIYLTEARIIREKVVNSLEDVLIHFELNEDITYSGAVDKVHNFAKTKY